MLTTTIKIGIFLIIFTSFQTATGKTIENTDTSSDMDHIGKKKELALEQVIALAVKNSPLIQAAKAEVEVAEGKKVEAGLWENPELELSSEEIPWESGGILDAKNMIGLSQEIPFPGKISLEISAAYLAKKISYYRYSTIELEIIRDVKTAYFHVLFSEAKVRLFEELLELSHSMFITSGKQIAAGEVPIQEQLRAEIEWQNSKSEMEYAKEKLAEARQRLWTLAGISDVKNIVLEETLSIGNDSFLEDSVVEQLKRHPKIKEAQASVQKASVLLKLSKKSYLPDITFKLAVGHKSSKENGGENLADAAISFPLPFFNYAQGKERKTKGKLFKAKANLADINQKMLEQLRNKISWLHANRERVNRFRNIILPKVDKVLSLMKKGVLEGKFRLVDLLDTQHTVMKSRMNYLEALLELNVTRASLEFLLNTDNIIKKEK